MPVYKTTLLVGLRTIFKPQSATSLVDVMYGGKYRYGAKCQEERRERSEDEESSRSQLDGYLAGSIIKGIIKRNIYPCEYTVGGSVGGREDRKRWW